MGAPMLPEAGCFIEGVDGDGATGDGRFRRGRKRDDVGRLAELDARGERLHLKDQPGAAELIVDGSFAVDVIGDVLARNVPIGSGPEDRLGQAADRTAAPLPSRALRQ
jgi:hypothetical protein